MINFFPVHFYFSGCTAKASEKKASNQDYRHVLVLNSYHFGYEWADSTIKGIREQFDESGEKVDLYIEFMDTKRHFDDDHFSRLRELYKYKFSDRDFDVIISCDDNSLNFLLANRENLLPSVPIVFCGINNFAPPRIAGYENITGVGEGVDFRANIDLALQLHPSLKRIVVVGGSSPSAAQTRRLLEQVVPEYVNRVRFDYLVNLSMSDLLKRLEDVPRSDVVFHFGVLKDKEGENYIIEHSNKMTISRCKAPVYTFWNHQMTPGVFGGYIVNGASQGRTAAALALRILRGEDADDIPVITESPNLYIFNYDQLQRFGIDISSLPEGHIVLDRPFSFYETYEKIIWSVVLAFIILLFIIAALVGNIILRKQAEDALRESEEKYRSLAESTEDCIYLVDENLRYLFANKKIQSRFDLPMDKVIGRKYGDFHSKDETKNFAEKVNKVFETVQSLSYEYLSKRDGRYFIRTLSPVKEPDKKVTALTLISKDITKRKLAEESLKQANEKLQRAHDQRKILSKRLIDLLEKERRQIAMELHDHVGQTLTTLKIDLEILNDQLKPFSSELRFMAQAAADKTMQTMKDVKNVSHGLRPGMIDTLGLVSSLRELFNKARQSTNMEINFFSRRMPKHFDQEKELAIYRIAQEALNNIVRHARAKNVFVNLVKKDDKLLLSVEDDGVGFDQDKVMKTSKRKGPLGLLIMRERAIQLDGEFTLESQPGQGTHVLVEIPL